jgi:hypothetical protein
VDFIAGHCFFSGWQEARGSAAPIVFGVIVAFAASHASSVGNRIFITVVALKVDQIEMAKTQTTVLIPGPLRR